jgi:hypothetical protein
MRGQSHSVPMLRDRKLRMFGQALHLQQQRCRWPKETSNRDWTLLRRASKGCQSHRLSKNVLSASEKSPQATDSLKWKKSRPSRHTQTVLPIWDHEMDTAMCRWIMYMSSARRASSRDQNVNTVSIPAVKICAVHGVLRLEVHIPNDDGKGVGNWCPRFDIRTLDGMSLESDESTCTWNCCRRLDVTLHVGWKTWNMSLFCFCVRPNPNNPKSKSD